MVPHLAAVKRISGFGNFRSPPQKDFCNKIGAKETSDESEKAICSERSISPIENPETDMPSIPATLITGIRSELPGQITAQVTENVYDTDRTSSADPQGARLIGSYDNQIAFGQSRVLLVWSRLIMPNGRSIVLVRQTAPGLRTRSTNHRCELLKAAALFDAAWCRD